MASSSLYTDGHAIPLLAKGNEALPQKSNPNAYSVVKKRSIPRLGDGLCGIFAALGHSPTRTVNSTPSTVVTRSNTPTSTASRQTLTTCISTPDISIISSNAGSHADVIEKATTSNKRNRSYLFSPISPGVSIQESNSLVQSPPALGAYGYVALPRDGDTLYEISHPTVPPTSSNSNQVSSTRLEAHTWLHNSQQASFEVRQIVVKDHSKNTLGNLNSFGAHEKGDQNECLIAQPQNCDGSFNLEPLEYTEPLRSNLRPSCPAPVPVAKVDKQRERFYIKLMDYVNADSALVSPSQSSQANLHVFVDMSNIFIGFCETYKISRKIPMRRRIHAPHFSFRTLALLMERTRYTYKRVLAGSAYAGNSRSHWPAHFFEAEKLNYQMNIFSRVQKRIPSPAKSKQQGKTTPQGKARSSPSDVVYDSVADSAGDRMASTIEIRNGEQGVDENIHLNMMESMWDYMHEPGTIVLATGDAAEAEFSPGFFCYALRALEKGWRFELVAWKRTTSSNWTSLAHSSKYANRFRIIFLDDFLEELHADILPGA
ncbi:uncharacterized protein GGS25DRAFT_76489 [Hypoxylon fragiforme]|uniref:uncharacterized protein n=1 Tax=Hypoxylon fragiforme TaxID=63214 RepID=UPI0020C6BCF0|nr:uncharacterized protein GGS25DRAFT_76489 [Hypoxylon fragiforme]KAI2602996.1 hypothetical protein GGS25DRAFT_76489 [Hypoxylon fragiforme]